MVGRINWTLETTHSMNKKTKRGFIPFFVASTRGYLGSENIPPPSHPSFQRVRKLGFENILPVLGKLLFKLSFRVPGAGVQRFWKRSRYVEKQHLPSNFPYDEILEYDPNIRKFVFHKTKHVNDRNAFSRGETSKY